MRRTLLLLTLVGSMLVVCGGGVLAQSTTPEHTAPDDAKQQTTTPAPPKTPTGKIPDQYIVVLKDDARGPTAAVAQEHARRHGLEALQTYQYALKGYAAKIPASQLDKVRSDGDVLFVSEDREVQATAQETIPTGIKRIGSEPSTKKTNNGRGVGVAVIDTGIDLGHPDLSGVQNGKNCIDTTKTANDDHGHGTHVAGTIAARNNGEGVVGVAPEATPYAVKVLNSSGSGSLSQVICGIDWVTQNAKANNIKVANMSLAGSASDDNNCGNSNNDAFHKAICNSVAAGVTYAVAAGNESSDLATKVPAAYNEVATVTALADFDGEPGGRKASTCRSDVDDTAADFSNYATSAADQNHTIAAPGVCIESTWPQTLPGNPLRPGYNTISGTSMATPHVAGTAALYLANSPEATPTEVITALREDAKLKSDPSANPYYGFTDDPNKSSNNSRFYSYLEWPGGYFGNTNPLRVGEVSPPDGATQAVVSANVTATFSRDMDPTTLTPSTVTLVKDRSTTPVGATVSYDAATRKVTLDPSVDLEPGTKYTATIKGGAADCTSCAKDKTGNPLAADKVWSFTTTDDIIPPTISEVGPSDGATQVALTANVRTIFSEDMDPTTLTPSTVTLVKNESDGSTTPVDATVSYNPDTHKVRLDPSDNLEASTKYTATVKGGATNCTSCAKDKVGNPLAADKGWTFTTTDDTTPPKTIENSPTGRGDVSRYTNVTVKFSEDVKGATVTPDTFMLAKGPYPPTPTTSIKSGTTVSYDPETRTATLDPYGSSTSRLETCKRYTAKLTSGVTDKAGNPAVEIVWTFKTAGC